MSQEPTTPDLEARSRQLIEAANRRDFDAVVAAYAPAAVWDGTPADGVVFQGREAIRGFFEDWIGAYEDYRSEIEEFRDFGNSVSFEVVHGRGRPKGVSGFVELRYAAVATWVDGLVDRATTYLDIAEARAAAEGLAEERR